MKYIKSKKISPRKYLLTLEVSEYDMEMFENLATTYAPFQIYEDNKDKINFNFDCCEFTPKFRRWTLKLWKTFWMLWRKHSNDKK